MHCKCLLSPMFIGEHCEGVWGREAPIYCWWCVHHLYKLPHNELSSFHPDRQRTTMVLSTLNNGTVNILTAVHFWWIRLSLSQFIAGRVSVSIWIDCPHNELAILCLLYPKCRNVWFFYLILEVLGPSEPRLLAGGPSGLLTSSFTPFGRSGRVTHATVIG